MIQRRFAMPSFRHRPLSPLPLPPLSMRPLSERERGILDDILLQPAMPSTADLMSPRERRFLSFAIGAGYWCLVIAIPAFILAMATVPLRALVTLAAAALS